MNGMRRVYTAHPITVLRYLKPFLFILLLPLFKAVIRAVFESEIDGWAFNEAIIFLAIFVYSVIKWKKLRLTITDRSVQITSGLFLRRFAEIPIEKISTIETVRYLTDYFFASTTLRINTEAGRKGKADYEIKLRRYDAEQICKELSGTSAVKTLKFSAVRVAIMAATSSSAFTGLIFTVPIVKKTGDLLGTAIEEILIDRLYDVTAVFDRYLPPIINAVTIIFLALYAVSFMISFFRCVNFYVRLGSGRLEIENGLLIRRTIGFGTKSVNSVLIEQTPLMRIFKRFLVRVSVGGYGDNKGNKAVIVPSAKKSEVKELFSAFFPNIRISDDLVKPKSAARRRFYFVPTLFLLISFSAYGILLWLFPIFQDLLVFALIIITVILIYYYNLAEYNVKNSAISVSDVLYAKYTRWSATREMYCEADRIGIISITKWPADRKYGTCNIRLVVRSENAESITVKHIDYSRIRKKIGDFYGFE